MAKEKDKVKNTYVFDTFDELTDYVALAFTSTNDWVCGQMEEAIGDKLTIGDREKVYGALTNGFMQLADNMKCAMAEYEHLVSENKVPAKKMFYVDPDVAGYKDVEEWKERIKKDVREGTEYYTSDIKITE